jgi:hypothetical protein
MPRWAAGVITVLSFPFGPGVVVVLGPWLITHWHHGALYPIGVRALGVVLLAAATLVMIAAFARFPAGPPTITRGRVFRRHSGVRALVRTADDATAVRG